MGVHTILVGPAAPAVATVLVIHRRRTVNIARPSIGALPAAVLALVALLLAVVLPTGAATTSTPTSAARTP
jgi:hypothetical protein